jgi:hypothetical protein
MKPLWLSNPGTLQAGCKQFIDRIEIDRNNLFQASEG